MKNFHLFILATVLSAIGLSLFCYKVFFLHFSVTPDEESEVWLVETKIGFKANGRPVKVELYIPNSAGRFLVTDENFVSGGYGLTTAKKKNNRRALWSVQSEDGWQTLYYRSVIRRNYENQDIHYSSKPVRYEFLLPDAEGAAVKAIIKRIKKISADEESFIANLIELLKIPKSDKNMLLLTGTNPSESKRTQVLITILKKAGMAVRSVQGIDLNDVKGLAKTLYRVEVFIDGVWTSYDINSGSTDISDTFMPWWYGGDSLSQVKGGSNLIVNISVQKSQEDLVRSAVTKSGQKNSLVLDFSLLRLPVDTQMVYRVLLLIPLGAFLVVILRNIVGIKTFGTFMPVLIALAFRETELLWGIILFILLLFSGLLVRFYLEHLKLLLVPRLASILIVVVIFMVLLSILTNKLGFDRGLSVALFPMVIIAMTIERMSIVWDELGASEALKQGVGTLLVSSSIFVFIFNRYFEHLLFVFPELLLVVLAVTLLLGRYTGYRIVELYRFREFNKE